MSDTAVMLGGTFNPVTKAHIAMGRRAAEYLPEANLIYVPSNLDFMTRWKEISDSDRWFARFRNELLEAGLKELPGAEVSYIEAEGTVDGRTYNSVRYLLSAGYSRVYICMGADKVEELEKWYRAGELLETAHVILFCRDGDMPDLDRTEFLRVNRDRFTLLDAPVHEKISSTAIREAFAAGDMKTVESMMPPEAYDRLTGILSELH